MNIMESNLKHQPQPQHRRKAPSFSSSLLDSILRSIDESSDETLHHQQQEAYDQNHDQDQRFFAYEQKGNTKIYFPQTHTTNGDDQMPSLRRAIMIDEWMETHNNNNSHNYGYVSSKSCRKFSSDSSSSGATSSGTETPSTYRSLPNSFTISRKTAEVVFRDDTHQQVNSINKREMKFMKSTRLKAMKIYGDLKKVKQPMSPGSRISTFLYSLFASSSSRKAKIEETMRSLKKSRSIKQDSPTTCTSFSRSCMSKKQRNSSVKRSVRFYPENDAVILDRKSIPEREPNLTQLPKYERRWLQEKKYMKNYNSFMVNVEDDEDEDHEDEDDLFELEIVGGLGNHVAYGQELPVFESTDLRKIRI